MCHGTAIHRWAVIAVIFVVMTLLALRGTARFGRAWCAVFGALTYPRYLVFMVRPLAPVFKRFLARLGLGRGGPTRRRTGGARHRR